MSRACLEMAWAYTEISWASEEFTWICLEDGGAGSKYPLRAFEVPGA